MKKPVFLAFFTAVILKFLFFDFIIAQGQSMEPSIYSGTVLVVSKLRYGFRVPIWNRYLVKWAEPEIGEVVVFYTPAGELAVKRCKGASLYGFYFEGDNELASYDSRAYGPVSADNIIGKVLGK